MARPCGRGGERKGRVTGLHIFPRGMLRGTPAPTPPPFQAHAIGELTVAELLLPTGGDEDPSCRCRSQNHPDSPRVSSVLHSPHPAAGVMAQERGEGRNEIRAVLSHSPPSSFSSTGRFYFSSRRYSCAPRRAAPGIPPPMTAAPLRRLGRAPQRGAARWDFPGSRQTTGEAGGGEGQRPGTMSQGARE